jgi:putative transposase
MAEELRFEASKIYNVTVSRTADMWFASISCEVPESENQAEGGVGIDVGIKDLATLSDGTKYGNPRIEKQFAKKIAYAQRGLARKQKGSNNRRKARMKLAKLYYRQACMRLDYQHKFTTEVCRKYAAVCLEDLNIKGMLANHKLAKAISDASWNKAIAQFGYKAKEVIRIGRFEPSSQVCHCCNYQNTELKLSDRVWVCPECGAKLDRDINAAKNILRWASPEVKPVDCHMAGRSRNLTAIHRIA